VREFLLLNRVPFTEIDILRDRGAMEELVRRGFRATPVTMVGDQAVVGFNRPKLEALLVEQGGKLDA